jgi:hypothetical protein
MPAGTSTHGLRFDDFSRSTELAEAAYTASVGYLQAAGFRLRTSRPTAIGSPDRPAPTPGPTVGPEVSNGPATPAQRRVEWPQLKPTRPDSGPNGHDTK